MVLILGLGLVERIFWFLYFRGFRSFCDLCRRSSNIDRGREAVFIIVWFRGSVVSVGCFKV